MRDDIRQRDEQDAVDDVTRLVEGIISLLDRRTARFFEQGRISEAPAGGPRFTRPPTRCNGNRFIACRRRRRRGGRLASSSY